MGRSLRTPPITPNNAAFMVEEQYLSSNRIENFSSCFLLFIPNSPISKFACTRSSQNSAEIIRNVLIYQVLPPSLFSLGVFFFLVSSISLQIWLGCCFPSQKMFSFVQSTMAASWAFYARDNRANHCSDTETKQNRAK
ncbi:hypothetical protein BT93_C2014 [Corymbia citriodora subsp. variegata]|nr:hypothetical protein BT93_C2014 [Corymbia citriodora subsp. variegata]